MEPGRVKIKQAGVRWIGLMVLGCFVWSIAALSAFAQASPGRQIARADSSEGIVAGGIHGKVVREIDDPECGARWLLLRDDSDPGGPGRLVLVQDTRAGTGVKGARGLAGGIIAGGQKPVIRAGDRLVIEQDMPSVSARLEAVALGSASAGKLVRVRLKMSGKVVEARALAAGRATLEPEALP